MTLLKEESVVVVYKRKSGSKSITCVIQYVSLMLYGMVFSLQMQLHFQLPVKLELINNLLTEVIRLSALAVRKVVNIWNCSRYNCPW